MTTPLPLTINHADERHRPELEQLWTMFRHEMSAFTGTLPDGRGRFRQERLDAGLAEPGWSAHVFYLGPHPVGLAILRGLDAEEHVISSFFVAHGARRSHIGRVAVTELTSTHPGRWAVAYQDRNEIAARFWRTVVTGLDPACRFERHAVPGRPDLPADSWARFRVR
jgi:predicted acetyltransferase